MPLYEYRCLACGHVADVIQKFSDPPLAECPACGGKNMEKCVSSPAIRFKGSGFYITDYAKKGKQPGKEPAAGKGGGKKEGGPKGKKKTPAKDT